MPYANNKHADHPSHLRSINNQFCFFLYFQSKLDMLNAIVWPEIASLAQTEIQKYGIGKS